MPGWTAQWWELVAVASRALGYLLTSEWIQRESISPHHNRYTLILCMRKISHSEIQFETGTPCAVSGKKKKEDVRKVRKMEKRAVHDTDGQRQRGRTLGCDVDVGGGPRQQSVA